MAIDRSPRRRGIPQRLATAGRKAVAALGLLGLLLPCPAQADWLGKLVGAAQRLSPAPTRRTKALDNLAAHIKTLPAKPEATVLAAEATPEGHWRFVNKAGETITAGTPEEMKRVVLLLVPDAKAEARLTLYLTQDTVFARRAALKDLPKGTELTIRVGEESYRILRRSEGAGERLFAEIRANLVVELADQQQFAEAAWQLARPLNKAGIRILALEPGSAPRLPSSPRLDPVSKKALIDSIDPASLAAALGAVRGQTVLVTGRIDGELLHFKSRAAPTAACIVRDLFSAAEQADVNLIVLHASSTPRQPGGRNWLWQKVEVKGLEEALQRARVADFYNALAAPNGRFVVSAKTQRRPTHLVGDRPHRRSPQAARRAADRRHPVRCRLRPHRPRHHRGRAGSYPQRRAPARGRLAPDCQCPCQSPDRLHRAVAGRALRRAGRAPVVGAPLAAGKCRRICRPERLLGRPARARWPVYCGFSAADGAFERPPHARPADLGYG